MKPTIQTMKLALLKPAAYNPRRISPEALKGLTASIKRFGSLQPIVFNKTTNRVVAGHQRLKAMGSMGIKETQVIVVEMSEKEEKAANIALNNPAIAGDFTDDLSTLLDELRDYDSQMFEDLRFDEIDIPRTDELKAGLTDPDEAPAKPRVAKSKPGDLYQLGDHRLICGDATKPEVWDRLLEGRVADCIWTDPPYGVAYIGKTKESLKIKNDNIGEAELKVLLEASLGLANQHVREGGGVYVAAPAGPLHQIFGDVLKALGIWRQTLVWVKDVFVMGRSDYHYRHEPIFYGWKEGAAHYFTNDRTMDTILEFSRPKVSTEHPTMKPVELIAHCINNSTKNGGLVVDPFSGSASTMIACEMAGRVYAGIELDPIYIDVSIKRWEEFSGKKSKKIV
jgi:DNA modification methylase